MSKPLFALLLIGLMSIVASAQKTLAPAQITDDAQQAKIKAAVAKVGVGIKARVQVKRFGKPKVNGFINQIEEDNFTVISTDEGSIGMARSIAYSEVAQLKGKGVNWRNGGLKASEVTTNVFRVLWEVTRGVCLNPISGCCRN